MFYYSVANIGINPKKKEMSMKNSVGYKANLSGTCGLAAFKCGQNEKTNLFFDTCPAGI